MLNVNTVIQQDRVQRRNSQCHRMKHYHILGATYNFTPTCSGSPLCMLVVQKCSQYMIQQLTYTKLASSQPEQWIAVYMHAVQSKIYTHMYMHLVMHIIQLQFLESQHRIICIYVCVHSWMSVVQVTSKRCKYMLCTTFQKRRSSLVTNCWSRNSQCQQEFLYHVHSMKTFVAKRIKTVHCCYI